MQAVMLKSVKQWLEENIEELNQVYEDHRSSVILILSYALMSGAGLTKQEFLSIVTEKGKGKMQHEAGSVAEELVNEGKAEKQREIAVRFLKMGLSDQRVAEGTGLPLNTVADLRREVESSD